MASPCPMPVGPRPQQQRLTLDRRKEITFPGKSFYLDLPPSKQTQLLTKAIMRLGGVIEGFLSRDLHYVVTGGKKGLDSVKGGLVEAKKGARSKPQAAESMEPAMCRGKQLLKKVAQKQECSSVLTSARSWGVSILHLDEVLEYLENGHHPSRAAEGKSSVGVGKLVKIAKLKIPFLKIEDQSRKYRPLQFCFSIFPEVSFRPSSRSPFETVRPNTTTNKEKDAGEAEAEGSEQSLRPNAWEKSGYCECCRETYTKLSEHVLTELHGQFALDASNYKVIDDLLGHIPACDLMQLPLGFKPALCVKEGKPDMPEDCRMLAEDTKGEPGLSAEGNAVTIEEETNALGLDNGLAVKSTPKDVMVGEAVITKEQSYLDNALDRCVEPLNDKHGAGAASHMGVVTEVSWYTEETGLTTIYTVQSLVVPPEGQATDLDMANTLESCKPPQHLIPQDNALSALVTECLNKAPNAPKLSEASACNIVGSHGSDLLMVEQPSELTAKPSGVPLHGIHVQLPTLIKMDENMKDLPMQAASVCDQLPINDIQNEPILNGPEVLQQEGGMTLSQDALNVMPFFQCPAVTSLADSLTGDPHARHPLNDTSLYHAETDVPVVVSSISHLVYDFNTNVDKPNPRPLYQDFIDTSAVMANLTHLVNGSNMHKDQFNMGSLNYDTLDNPVVKTSITHLVNDAYTDEVQCNLKPVHQDAMMNAAHLMNGSNIDWDQLNLKPVQHEATDTPAMVSSVSQLVNGSYILKPVHQDAIDIPSMMSSITQLVTGSRMDEDQLNPRPLRQNFIDLPPVMTSITHLVNGSNTNIKDPLKKIPLYPEPIDASVEMQIVASHDPVGGTDHDSQAHSPAVAHGSSTPKQPQQLHTTDGHSGKRKHNGSPCCPPAKRSPCLYQPVPIPIWLFHQFPDTGYQLAQLMEGDSSNMTKHRARYHLSSNFNPKLVQYNATSELDWDSDLLSQRQDNHASNVPYKDLCTTKVNLDDSWYGRQLSSVLAHEQGLCGGCSSAQAVTLPHTTCDFYLHGVAS